MEPEKFQGEISPSEVLMKRLGSVFLVLKNVIQCQKLEAGPDRVFSKPKVIVHQWVANSIKKKKKGWVRMKASQCIV